MRLIKLFIILSLFSNPMYAVDWENFAIHGFASQGYLKSDENHFLGKSRDGSFEFTEVGLNVSTEIYDKVRLGLQLFARDLGSDGNNNVSIDWAFGDYAWRDELGVRIGRIKLPNGFYNQGRDADMLRTSILLPQSVYAETTRDISVAFQGGEIYGNLGAGFMGDFEYEVFLGTLDIADESSFIKDIFFGFRTGAAAGTDAAFIDPTTGLSSASTVARQDNGSISTEWIAGFGLIWNTPLDGLRAGVSSYFIDGDLTGDFDLITSLDIGQPFPATIVNSTKFAGRFKIEHYVASLEYTWNNLVLQSEFRWEKLGFKTAGTSEFDDSYSIGYYGAASYRFCSWFELGAYYSVSWSDKDDHDKPEEYTRDMALSLRFDVNDNWIIKGEAHFFDGTSILLSELNQNNVEDDWNMLAIKATFVF